MRDESVIFVISNPNRTHLLHVLKTNRVANTGILIVMKNGDRFIATKQYLVSVLPLVKPAELTGGGRWIKCLNCGLRKDCLGNNTIWLRMKKKTDWFNCAG